MCLDAFRYSRKEEGLELVEQLENPKMKMATLYYTVLVFTDSVMLMIFNSILIL